MKKLFLDLETTSNDPAKAEILQLYAAVEYTEGSTHYDGLPTPELELRMKPTDMSKVQEGALKASGLTVRDLQSDDRIDQRAGHKHFFLWLAKIINMFDTRDKLVLYGYNVMQFDMPILHNWFLQYSTKYQTEGKDFFFSFFWPVPVDVMSFAMEVLGEERRTMPAFTQAAVAKHLDVNVVSDRAQHDAKFDVAQMRLIYEYLRRRYVQGGL